MTRDDEASRGEEGEPRERSGPRSQLPIPVRARIGAAPSRESRLHDVSVSGFRIDWTEPAEVGQPVIARFDGYPGICPPFILHGRVAHVASGRSPGVGVAIDRTGSSPDALASFRELVLHYLRHKPLLVEVARDFFEGRCKGCGWIGRVGTRAAACPRCKETVRPLDPGQ